MPFDSLFDALGVSFDLNASSLGSVSVRNTAARVVELCNDLQEILDKGSLGAKQAQHLRGRMQFAEVQMFGRTGRRCLKVLNDFSEGHRQQLRAKDAFFLRLFMCLLPSNIPREIKALGNDNVVIFTDACYERESSSWPCGLGGVICFGGQNEFFSLPVDKLGRAALGEDFKKQIIFEAETLAAVLAFDLWKDFFAKKPCLIFVDNEGTKFSLLKGSSDNDVVDCLSSFFAELEAGVHAFTWLARVPSKSNIADPPSRNDVGNEFFLNATNVSTRAAALLQNLVTRLNEVGVSEVVTSQSSKKNKRS